MTTARALCVILIFLAVPAARAQYAEPPPPPPGTPPPPPPAYRPPPPPYRPRHPGPFVRPEAAPPNTARVSVGFAFANDGYDCWYTGVGATYYGCGYGYGFAWPNVNAEVDLGINPLLAVTVGGNVFWGTDNNVGVRSTIWEPHVDLLLRSSPYTDVRGRLRIGVGLYAAHASTIGFGGTSDETGAAFRLGAGVSFFARSRVGLGIDGIFEAGSIGGSYVSDFHLLIGPELHF